MRTLKEYEKVMKLRKQGLSQWDISDKTGIPRGTIKDWVIGNIDLSKSKYKLQIDDPMLILDTESKKQSYSYVLGMYLGDGYINKMKRTYRIRIAQDNKYSSLIELQKKYLSDVLADNSVCITKRNGDNCVDISAYSNNLPVLFPQHGKGKKHERKIELLKWQKNIIKKYPEEFIRGLIHSDGCVFYSQGKLCYEFSNMSKDILGIFAWAIGLLNIKCTFTWKSANIRKKSEVEKMAKFVEAKS